MSTKGKILVIRGGAIGDFILTLPVLAALRQQFPDTHLEVLGYPHIAQLALAGGLADRVQPIEARALAAFFARNGELPEDQRDYFSEFNLIVSYLYDPDEIFRENLARCSPAQFIAAPHRPEEREGIHATEVFLNPLTRLAIFDADPVPRLAINHQPSTINRIALHPGSGSERKNWPEAKWAELGARLIAETNRQLLLVGGEAEGERLQRLAAKLPAARSEIAQSLPLADLAARLSACAAFAGHDSGITHLAAALGLPCVVLWADTNEELWRPKGDQISILRSDSGISGVSVDQVVLEILRFAAVKS
jgi:ADP-heptose:LPS heptosyltransferase